jgi:hypothetical protein
LEGRNPDHICMLNIPSGNGRLNGLFSEFVANIDCVDPCKKACEIVALQKKEKLNKEKIGMILNRSI